MTGDERREKRRKEERRRGEEERRGEKRMNESDEVRRGERPDCPTCAALAEQAEKWTVRA